MWMGDPHKKAELKKALPNFFIGAIIFIGATNIVYYLIIFANNIQ